MSSKVKTAPANKASGASGVKKGTHALPSAVEQWYYEQSGRKLQYSPDEKVPVIEVSNFPALGRLTALRFIEWVLENPEGVVSLPTGKTPEYFIRWSQHFLSGWKKKEIQAQLDQVGLAGKSAPSFAGLTFVQIDEFYPIDPQQQNSFYYYVNKHYLRGFGMDPNKAMLINPAKIGIPKGKTLETVFPDGKVDLGLRHRLPTSELERLQAGVIMEVDQFCSDYEEKIRARGGIGFFLGGIGPDGHIGFNFRGSDLQSPTRLTYTNYETEAAAAGDLGGIEVSRNKPVITIGLGTISHNPDGVAIIFAAGEAKSRIVADSVTSDMHVRHPASVLSTMKNARFYLTKGSTVKLRNRVLEDILQTETLSESEFEKRVIDRALALDKRLDQIRDTDAKGDELLGAALKKAGKGYKEAAQWVRERLVKKIEAGTESLSDQSILHTGPHHDDIMLGYMPYVMHLVRNSTNKNYFTVLTSGFTAVTNGFLAGVFEDLENFIEEGAYDVDISTGVFHPENPSARAEEVFRYLDGVAAQDDREMKISQARRMLYNLMLVYEDEDIDNIKLRLKENLHYLRTVYPGKKDIKIIQTLKGMQREYEEELIWGYVGIGPSDVFHGRLGFYTGDIFTKAPTQDRDVAPVLQMLEDLKPNVVSLAFDPEGTGPDTHYKVLQVLHEALLQYRDRTGIDPEVWGYRNVWHRYHPSDANVYIPVSLNTIAVMAHSFMNCFGSQKNASFPSFEYDGPFCYQTQKVWVEQFRYLRTLLGHEWFEQNPSPRIRAARAFVYLRKMPLSEFSGAARALAEITEAAM